MEPNVEGIVDVWECPECGYLITNIEYESVRFDYGCPVCHASLLIYNPKFFSEIKRGNQIVDE